MPRMDGRGAFQEMEKVHPGVRVILSSGFSEQETVPQLLGKGLTGFLQKPYTLGAPRKIVQEVLPH